MLWGEKESRHRPWIFFLVFCYISNVLVIVRRFRLHSCVSSVKTQFGAHSKLATVIFVSLYIFVAGVQLLFLPCHVSESTNLQTRVIPLLPPGVGGRTYPLSVVPILCRSFWTSCFFLVIFNYRIHSPVWPTTNALALLSKGQLAVPVDSLLFLLPLHHSKFTSRRFLTSAFHIMLQV